MILDPVPEKYAAGPERVAELLRTQAFGWIVSLDRASPHATALPLRAGLAADGTVASLRGHFARANPHVEALRRDPRALILMLGPHGYVSPSWFEDRTQAPTWNYASAQFLVEVRFQEDEAALREVVDDLVEAMEAGRPNAWRTADMGERYERLARGIIAFQAEVLDSRAVFKLGQDERDDVYGEILAGLSGTGAHELESWMRALNPGRAP